MIYDHKVIQHLKNRKIITLCVFKDKQSTTRQSGIS